MKRIIFDTFNDFFECDKTRGQPFKQAYKIIINRNDEMND